MGSDVVERVHPAWQDGFSSRLFEPDHLADQGLLCGLASAGRGATWFLDWQGTPLVLRHYRRGGLVRHLSQTHYLWCGLERTRAMAEFEILRYAEAKGLSSPRAVAAQIRRQGVRYQAALITERVPGSTWWDRLASSSDPMGWAGIGRCIGCFHRSGIDHADLNAHNIMVNDVRMESREADTRPDQSGAAIHLIDFDRARRRDPDAATARRWQTANLQRLRRSLTKRLGTAWKAEQDPRWQQLIETWSSTLEKTSPAP